MKLFNKLSNANKLFCKMSKATNVFNKIIQASKPEYKKVEHFITNTPKHHNSIKRLAPPVVAPDNMFV